MRYASGGRIEPPLLKAVKSTKNKSFQTVYLQDFGHRWATYFKVMRVHLIIV